MEYLLSDCNGCSHRRNCICKMANRSCCVADCKSTKKNIGTKFYTFPVVEYKLPQREKWIKAVRNVNKTPAWIPKRSDRICSAHFIGNAKSDEQMSPSYAPTIFTSIKMSPTKLAAQALALARHARFMKRRTQEILERFQAREVIKRRRLTEKQADSAAPPPEENFDTIYVKSEQNIDPPTKSTIHRQCQVETFIQHVESSKTLICNRYIYSSHGEAEIQTDIDIPGLAAPIKQEPEYGENFSQPTSTAIV